MKIFTLTEAELYFDIINKVILELKSLSNETNTRKREFLTKKKEEIIHYIEKDINREIRILYILRYFSYNNKYNLIDYNIIGNYEDIVIRLEDKEVTTFPDFN